MHDARTAAPTLSAARPSRPSSSANSPSSSRATCAAGRRAPIRARSQRCGRGAAHRRRDRRLAPARGLGALAELADAFKNGAFVAGPAIVDWHALDLADRDHPQRSHDGAQRGARGSGKAILDGDPFGTVVLLANAPADARRGLVAGAIVTTGSCTGAPLLPGPGTYRAEFATLGSVEFRFAA
jgi:hypothetical protein